MEACIFTISPRSVNDYYISIVPCLRITSNATVLQLMTEHSIDPRLVIQSLVVNAGFDKICYRCYDRI